MRSLLFKTNYSQGVAVYSQRKESVNYKNFGITHTFKNAHSDVVTCMCHIKNGIFITGSKDGKLRIWQAKENKHLAELEEEKEVSHFIKIQTATDINIIYVSDNTVNLLSLKQQRAIKLQINNSPITCITSNDYNK